MSKLTNLNNILYIIAYIFPIILIITSSILFLGYVDYLIIIVYGILNTFLNIKFNKLDFIKSLLLGFFVATFSMLIIVFLYNFQFITNQTASISVYLIISLLIIFSFNFLKVKLKYATNLMVLLITLTSIFTISKIKDYYPNESKNMKQYSFKITDKNENNIVSDSVEFYTLRQPLFNLKQVANKKYLKTNNQGYFLISLSELSNYTINIHYKNKSSDYFTVYSDELKKQNHFSLKSKKNNITP